MDILDLMIELDRYVSRLDLDKENTSIRDLLDCMADEFAKGEEE